MSCKPRSSGVKGNSGRSTDKLSLSREPGMSHPQPQRLVNSAPTLEIVAEEGSSTAEVQPRETSNVSQVAVVSSKSVDPILHHRRDRGGPHRVSKPQKKPRAAQSAQTFASVTTNQVSALHDASNVNRVMESLRMAILTDHIRAQHDLDLKEKESEQACKMLHDHVKEHEATIIGLKAQQLESKAYIARLTEKARTNQKYVVGIQTDYEKLRNSVRTFHSDNKRILQDKITEIENEKKALQSEFEKTTDSLRQSQRKMVSAVDTIYAQLNSTELKRKHLFEVLQQQKSLYEEKKKRCEQLEVDLASRQSERQLNESVQRQFNEFMHQLSESFTPKIEKLSQLQLQYNQASDEHGRTSTAINECLEGLKQLNATPPSTAKDLEGIEKLLQRVFER